MIKELFTILFLTILLAPSLAYAADPPPVDTFSDICKKAPDSTVCKEKNSVNPNSSTKNPLFGPNGIFTKVVNIISILTAIAAIIGIMIGGFKFITSGSNSQEVTNAREIVLYAIIGLILAALAQAMVRFVLTKIG